jgi:hypothetical protein
VLNLWLEVGEGIVVVVEVAVDVEVEVDVELNNGFAALLDDEGKKLSGSRKTEYALLLLLLLLLLALPL